MQVTQSLHDVMLNCYFMYDVLMNFLLHLMFRRKLKGGGITYFKMLIQHLHWQELQETSVRMGGLRVLVQRQNIQRVLLGNLYTMMRWWWWRR